MKTAEPEILPEMMADLDALTDQEVRAIISKANELLDDRDKQRKKDALERARAILAEAGLPFHEERKKGGRPRKGATKCFPS